MRKTKIRILVFPMLILSLFILLHFATASAAHAAEREILSMNKGQDIAALIQDPAPKNVCSMMAR